MNNCFADMSEIVVEHEPLAGYTSYRVGGPARWLGRPRNVDELARLVARCVDEDIPVYTIGRGANLLVGDEGVDGMVIRLDGPAFRRVDWPAASSGGSNGDDRHGSANHAGEPGCFADPCHPTAASSGDGLPAGQAVTVLAGAGVDMYWLVRESVRRGLAGLEGLAGIPGRLGGIVCMNAGGKWGQIADVVGGLTVVDGRGDIRRLTPAEAGFGYRRSNLAGVVICDLRLELRAGSPIEIRQRLKDAWRLKSATQPMREWSAGCVFKNPPGGSAGGLIDRAGLKGRSVGGARVSQVHANFIVVAPGVTAEDIFTLIGQVRREVARQFGVELDLEIEVWGRRHARVPEPTG